MFFHNARDVTTSGDAKEQANLSESDTIHIRCSGCST
jgi:hypothetical protein